MKAFDRVLAKFFELLVPVIVERARDVLPVVLPQVAHLLSPGRESGLPFVSVMYKGETPLSLETISLAIDEYKQVWGIPSVVLVADGEQLTADGNLLGVEIMTFPALSPGFFIISNIKTTMAILAALKDLENPR